MKTPMQELIDWASFPATEDNTVSIIDKMNELLEKEKQVIIDAVNKGYYHVSFQGNAGENYFNETFKKPVT